MTAHGIASFKPHGASLEPPRASLEPPRASLEPPRAIEAPEWLMRRCAPIRLSSPDGDWEDLEPLKAVIGNARVIAFAEPDHRVHEFEVLRDRVMRYLVTELGFDALVMESGLAEGVRTDAWINGEPDDLDEVQQHGFTYGMGSSEEVGTMLRWMREHVAGGGSVRYFGMDLPGGIATPLPALEGAWRYYEPFDADFTADHRATITPLVAHFATDDVDLALPRYCAMDSGLRDRLTASIDLFVAVVESRRVELSAVTGRAAFEVALRQAVNAQQMDRCLQLAADAWGGVPRAEGRDMAMAANVQWVLDHLGPEARIMVSAHNGHLQRIVQRYPGVPLQTPAGAFLAYELGHDYVVIGTTMGQGDGPHGRIDPAPEGTIDALLSSTGLPALLLDLAAVQGHTVARADLELTPDIRIIHHIVPTDVTQAYDAIVHVEHISTSTMKW